MHLIVTNNLKIIAIVMSVFIYSNNASDGSVVNRLIDNTHHHSNRPPETPTTNDHHHYQSSSTHQQKPTNSHTLEKSKSSYAMLSQAMSEAVHHEFNSKYTKVVCTFSESTYLKWKFFIIFISLDSIFTHYLSLLL